MKHRITVLPQELHMDAEVEENLLTVLQRKSLHPDAPCGGNGSCGKCKVLVDGKEALACQTKVTQDMTVTLPSGARQVILTEGIPTQGIGDGYALAFDIGTTTVAGYLLFPDSRAPLAESAINPQTSFGADVISRIRHAVNGQQSALTDSIRGCADEIGRKLCQRGGVLPREISTISLVGNPAMQQLFLGISVKNLAQPPFAPVLTEAKSVSAEAYFPSFPKAKLLTVPGIGGFVGADTLACVLATKLHQQEQWSLLVDIGTNGEMVLGNQQRMIACSTAAGPALEGAGIRYGMRAMEGAIDHAWPADGKIDFSVIGCKEPTGICGTGLVDTVAAALDLEYVNSRGKLRCPVSLANIPLTQEDIRALQQAKGAIATGIYLMAEQLGIALGDIQTVYLAGAFGAYLNPDSAFRIGLLPSELTRNVVQCGNAAGSGAKLLAQDPAALAKTEQLAKTIVHLDLATVPAFPRVFAKNMYFASSQDYWCQTALSFGFSHAAPLDVATLQPREDVRSMCAADKCGAYGKNHTCPPACGSLEQCKTQMQRYGKGILVQTVGQLEKAIDTRGYRRTEQQHRNQFEALCNAVRSKYPNALYLGAGGCRICKSCSYPEPCRFPEKAISSMEAFGLFVTQVCKDNGLNYHYGEKTVTYSACILF